MALLLNKTIDEILNQMLANLSLVNGSTNPGSIMRLMLAIISNMQKQFYDELQRAHLDAFISTAQGDALDMIGNLVSCARYTDGELDDSYRERIYNQVTALEDCNQLAIRMAVLSIDGVSDLIFKRFTHGTGSYGIFLIPNDYTQLDLILSKVNEALDVHTAYGIRYHVTVPDLLHVSVFARLIFTKDAQGTDIITEDAYKALTEYINSRPIGNALVWNELISILMNVSDYIYDVDIYHYTINNQIVMRVNQECQWYEKFIESPEYDSIRVS